MNDFGLTRAPRAIVFGLGQRKALGRIAAQTGKAALVCTDQRLSAEPVFAAMMDDLKAHGVAVRVYDRTLAELPLSCIDDAVNHASGFGADMVIGIGGGSCMDLAKVVALLLAHGGHPRDYYGEFKVPGPVLPILAVPTTAGTGSEVTPVAVLGDPERAMKVGISSPHLIAHTAICDPELTMTCPPSLTAVSGADALTHAIEAYTALVRPATPTLSTDHVFVGKNVLSDAYALQSIRLLARYLPDAVKDGSNAEARVAVMQGAMLAGLAFGTGGTAAAHAIQYPVGALTHTPHGAGVAQLMPYVMAFNRSSCPAAVADVARAMGVIGASGEEELSRAAVTAVADLFNTIGIPKTLAELGLPADKLDWTAEQSMASQRLVKNNPRALDQAAMKTIIDAAFVGDLARLA
ncbi:MAG: iron-containing alcohol dehydrogenase [Pseudolabrys sp.]|nr:iron-containing alcohol dehydrogenase [Pseudolabrys sp.]